MKNKTIAILGGYGQAGIPIARLLLQESEAHIILAGRHKEKAEKVASQLNSEISGTRVSGSFADASRGETLRSVFENADMVLVCSTTAEYVREVAQTALAVGIDYMDIQYPLKRLQELQSLAPAILKAGRCFITEAGFHPGLPAAFVRYTASYFSHLKKAFVATRMNVQNIGSVDSVSEVMEELSDYQAYVFTDGQWREAGYWDTRMIDFGPDFGKHICFPFLMEEMRSLPELFRLEETGMFVAGSNWFVDYLVFPLGMALGRIKKGLASRPLTRLFIWGMRIFSRPPFGVVLKIEAEGEKDGRPRAVDIKARHEDGYYFTAVPTVACLLQYLDGSIAKPGLWMMGHMVDPIRLFKDMERMGIKIQVKITDGYGK